jgi:hypothetical protein
MRDEGVGEESRGGRGDEEVGEESFVCIFFPIPLISLISLIPPCSLLLPLLIY